MKILSLRGDRKVGRPSPVAMATTPLCSRSSTDANARLRTGATGSSNLPESFYGHVVEFETCFVINLLL